MFLSTICKDNLDQLTWINPLLLACPLTILSSGGWDMENLLPTVKHQTEGQEEASCAECGRSKFHVSATFPASAIHNDGIRHGFMPFS